MEKSKEAAIESFYDINTDFDWYTYTFEYFIEQLEKIGLTCDSFHFDLDRDNYIQMINPKCINERLFLKYCKVDLRTKEAKKVIVEYGVTIGTGRISNYIEEYDNNYTQCLNDKLSDFLTDLKKEYEYLTSEESIIETIKCNEYDFTSDGKVFY